LSGFDTFRNLYLLSLQTALGIFFGYSLKRAARNIRLQHGVGVLVPHVIESDAVF